MRYHRNHWYTHLKTSTKMILAFGAVAVVLPVLMFGVIGMERLNLFSRASGAELRVWFEPSEVVMSPGQTANIRIMAQYLDQDNKLIPEVRMDLRAGSEVELDNDSVVYPRSFAGKVNLANIQVTAQSSGVAEVEVINDSVFTSLPDLPIVSSTAKIIVR